MQTEKVSVTLDANLLAEARRHANGGSLSSYVNDGLRLKVKHDQLKSLLDDMDEQFGAPPEEVMAEIAEWWPE
jgi:Arc/MetJ family transcription regulator